MPSKEEKKRRRQIQLEISKREKDSLLESLPINEENLQSLFDYLDNKLGAQDCNHDYALTSKFFITRGLTLEKSIVKWFKSQGGFCDCEILFNIEEKFN